MLDDLKIGPEHVPDKPKQIKDLLLGEDCDEDFSLAEEDLSQTHKKLTETIVQNNLNKPVDEFAQLFMMPTEDQNYEPETIKTNNDPKSKPKEVKDFSKSKVKVSVIGGDTATPNMNINQELKID